MFSRNGEIQISINTGICYYGPARRDAAVELPSFEDFLSTLTEEDYESFAGWDNLLMYRVKTPMTDEDLNALIQHLTSSVAAASGRFAVKLLMKYHGWLAQNLSDI